MAYMLLTRDYGRFDGSVSARRDLHLPGEALPGHGDVVDVACRRGYVWNHEESELAA
ncbi:MAG: hypothetical protein OXF41_09965 [bacterium]|nr:hypothetical protein [bacterium]